MSSSCPGHPQQWEPRMRLRWTRQLHERFVLVVSELGGADKATPKSVMRAMAVPGLTLYHLKSHLQKYRLLGVSRGLAASPVGDAEGHDHRPCSRTQPEEYNEDTVTEPHRAFADGDKEALRDSSRSVARVQREVQRKLQDQIEVQRHLQLRIEAQGRYLQSVLRRAQEVLDDHSLGSDAAKAAELSELAASAVETGCLSSSSSSLSASPPRRRSADSCVTSSSSEAVSRAAAGSKRPSVRDCTVEQPVYGKRTFVRGGHGEEAEAEDGSSSEIDLNR